MTTAQKQPALTIIERIDHNNGTVEVLASDGRRYDIVPDTEYLSEGSYAYDTEEETRAAVQEEQSGLESGRLYAVGVRTFERCAGGELDRHCTGCSGWDMTDSIWGIVVAGGTSPLEIITDYN